MNLSRIRERQLETKTRSGSYWKPKQDKNIIRLFQFQHKVTAEDVKAGFFKKEQLGKVVEELDRPIVRHFGINKGPVISNASIMARYKALKNSEDPEDMEEAQKIKPSKCYFLNILDIDAKDKGIVLYGCPSSVYNKILDLLADEDYGMEMLGAKGRDIVIMYDKERAGTDKYRVAPRKEGLSEELPDGLKPLDLYSAEAYAQMGDQAPEETVAEEVVEENSNGDSADLEADPDLEVDAEKEKKEIEDLFDDNIPPVKKTAPQVKTKLKPKRR